MQTFLTRIRDWFFGPLTVWGIWTKAIILVAIQALGDLGLLITGHLPNPQAAVAALPRTFLFILIVGYLALWDQSRRQNQSR